MEKYRYPEVFFPVKDRTIAGTATYTSDPIEVKTFAFFGVWYRATSATGTPDITIQYEMSYDKTSDNFVIPEGAADIVTGLTDENPHVESLSPPPMTYIRFKVTGGAANPSDTVVNLVFFCQG